MNSIQEKIRERVECAIQEKVFPGCIVGMVKNSGERAVFPFGHHTYDTHSLSVIQDTIYDMASITKSIPTGSLALQLLDQGALKVDDQLITYVPEFRNSQREKVLIKHLLTYSLPGFGPEFSLAALKDKKAEEVLEIILTSDFEGDPGTVFKYTNTPALLLGLALERITGKKIDELSNEQFFKPLEMARTTFHPNIFSLEEIAPTEVDERWRNKLVHGEVHDESAYMFMRAGRTMGHAGLFSTAPDILTFLEVLLHEGELRGKQFFSKDTIQQMYTNQLENIGEMCGLGWELNQPRFMGTGCTPHTFGKTGFTGVLCVCDISKGVAFVIFSNRVYPKRPADAKAINEVRRDVADIIWNSL